MVAVIPVQAQAEPAGFNGKVRLPGLRWLQASGIDPDAVLPAGTRLAPYWRRCLDDLYQAYRQTCAYLAVHIERCTGGVTADHFIAKSKLPGQAYEWGNLRLASMMINARKCDFDDVLDPFCVESGWFRLELVSGSIYPSPDLNPTQQRQVRQTISRLGLDEPMHREMRARHYDEYRRGEYSVAHLRRYSPFVYAEADRQALL